MKKYLKSLWKELTADPVGNAVLLAMLVIFLLGLANRQ